MYWEKCAIRKFLKAISKKFISTILVSNFPTKLYEIVFINDKEYFEYGNGHKYQ